MSMLVVQAVRQLGASWAMSMSCVISPYHKLYEIAQCEHERALMRRAKALTCLVLKWLPVPADILRAQLSSTLNTCLTAQSPFVS